MLTNSFAACRTAREPRSRKRFVERRHVKTYRFGQTTRMSPRSYASLPWGNGVRATWKAPRRRHAARMATNGSKTILPSSKSKIASCANTGWHPSDFAQSGTHAITQRASRTHVHHARERILATDTLPSTASCRARSNPHARQPSTWPPLRTRLPRACC
jgi:hypothetical protein